MVIQFIVTCQDVLQHSIYIFFFSSEINSLFSKYIYYLKNIFKYEYIFIYI